MKSKLETKCFMVNYHEYNEIVREPSYWFRSIVAYFLAYIFLKVKHYCLREYQTKRQNFLRANIHLNQSAVCRAQTHSPIVWKKVVAFSDKVSLKCGYKVGNGCLNVHFSSLTDVNNLSQYALAVHITDKVVSVHETLLRHYPQYVKTHFNF